MTKYLALFLGFACLAISYRLSMPLSPDRLAVMLPEIVANTVLARTVGVHLFALMSAGMFLGFYWETKRR